MSVISFKRDGDPNKGSWHGGHSGALSCRLHSPNIATFVTASFCLATYPDLGLAMALHVLVVLE
jgi:hypothetical protein